MVSSRIRLYSRRVLTSAGHLLNFNIKKSLCHRTRPTVITIHCQFQRSWNNTDDHRQPCLKKKKSRYARNSGLLHQTITMNTVGCFNILKIKHGRICIQIKSIVQSLWQANGRSASQDIPRILRNSKVRHRDHKTPPTAPVPGLVNPVHTPILI